MGIYGLGSDSRFQHRKINAGGDGRVSVMQEWRADLDAFAPPRPHLRDQVDYQTLEMPSSASAMFLNAPLWVTPSRST